MTDIKDISIIGVTSHTLEDNSKSTAFIYDSSNKSIFGLVYFTGAYWQVSSLGEQIDYELKKKLRIKVARSIPSDYCIIDNPLLYFYNDGRELKQASIAQKSYVEKLYGSSPKFLCADIASCAISVSKVYDMFMNAEYYKHRKIPFKLEEENIFKLMKVFKSTDHKSVDQFVFMEKLTIINDNLSDYYQKITKPDSSFKI